MVKTSEVKKMAVNFALDLDYCFKKGDSFFCFLTTKNN